MKVTYGAIVQRASGRFGGTVHSNWKGIDVVRRFAKPSNPNSSGQQAVRAVFKNLTLMFTVMPTYTKAAWTTFAQGKPFIARNKLIGVNVPLLDAAVDWSLFQPTPGDSSTLAPTAFVPTGANDSITTVITPPTAPTGWSITRCIACAIDDGSAPTNPDIGVTAVQIYEAADATNPYEPTISVPGSQTYSCWAFIEWLAPDGTTRYSAPIYGGTVNAT